MDFNFQLSNRLFCEMILTTKFKLLIIILVNEFFVFVWKNFELREYIIFVAYFILDLNQIITYDIFWAFFVKFKC